MQSNIMLSRRASLLATVFAVALPLSAQAQVVTIGAGTTRTVTGAGTTPASTGAIGVNGTGSVIVENTATVTGTPTSNSSGLVLISGASTGVIVDNAGLMDNNLATGGSVVTYQTGSSSTAPTLAHNITIFNRATGVMESGNGPISFGSTSSGTLLTRNQSSVYVVDNSGQIRMTRTDQDGAINFLYLNSSATSSPTINIFNRSTGVIEAARTAIRSGTATIDNSGIIRNYVTGGAIAPSSTSGSAIDIRGNGATGTIFNRAGGVIEGQIRAISGAGAANFVAGAIATENFNSVRHIFVTNEAGGIIRARDNGALATGANAAIVSNSGLTIDNAGVIESLGSSATASRGIFVTGIGDPNSVFVSNITIRSTGTVSGGAGAAIELGAASNPNDTVTIEAGATITGAINLGGGSGDTLNLGGAGNGVLNSAIQNTEVLNVNAGNWTLASNSSGAATTIANGATLNLGTGGTTGFIDGAIVNNGALVINRSNDITQAATSLISGTGSLTQSGGGTFILAAGNTYTGATNVNAGSLQASEDNTLASASVHIIAAGATLDLADFNQSIASLSGAGNVTLGTGNLTLTNGASNLFSGVISGSGGLRQLGSGTFILSGANTYSGSTFVTGGTLAAGATNSFSSTSNLIVGLGGTADLAGFDQIVNALASASFGGGRTVALGAGTLTIAGGVSATFDGAITGTGGLTQGGSGTTTLLGSSTYSGATTISNGTLVAGAVNVLSANSALTVTSAGTLDLAGNNQSAAGLNGAGAVNLGAGTLNLTGAGDSSFSGAIAGTGGVTQTGTGTLTLSGNNSYTGTTTATAGMLVNAGALAGGISATNATVVNNGTGVTDLTLTNATYSGAGAISGNVNATGSMATLGGTIGGNVSADNSMMTIGAAITGSVTGTNNAAITNNSSIGSADISSGATLAGNGTVNGTVVVGNMGTLSGGQTITGAVTVANGGTIAPGSSGIGTLNVGALNLAANAILNFDFGAPNLAAGVGSDYVNVTNNLTLDGILNINNLGALGPGVYRLFGYGGTLTNNGLSLGTIPSGLVASDFVIQTAASGEVNIVSNGTPGLGAPPALQFWDGANAGLFNNGIVNGGTGNWQTTGAPSWSLADGSGNNQWGDGFAVFQGTAGIVSVVGAINTTGMQFTTNGYEIAAGAGGSLNLTDPVSVLRIDNAADTARISVGLTGTGGITIRGAGTIILSGTNTNTGATAIEGGTLRVEGGQALSDILAVTITSPGRLQLGSSETIGGLLGSGSVDLGSSVLTLTNSSDAIYAGNISGAGSLNFAGTASQTLSGTNSYTGGTSVSTGTLRAGSTSAFGTGPVSIAGGATLDLAGFATSIGDLSGAGNLALGAADLSVGGTNSSSTFAGVISGTGSLNHVGTGTLTLSGVNSYTGATTVSGGNLVAGAVGALGTGAVTVASGATLNLANFNNSVASLAGAGTVDLGAATLTSNTGAAGATFAGAINGTGGVTMAGSGVQTLSGTNSYTGTTAVNTGSLRAGSTSAFGAGNVNVASGATLDLAGFSTILQTLNGAGAVSLGAGNLTVGANNASSSFAGIISGPGSLTQSGSGIFTLSGANIYTGATTVNSGILRAGAVNTLGSGAVTVASGATLDLAGFNNSIGALNGAGAVNLGLATLTLGTGNASGSFAGIVSGAGSVTKIGTGTQTLSGTNSYSGGTTVNGGILRAGSSAAFGTGPVAVGAGATLDLAGFNTAIGALSGMGNVTLGSAALTLGMGNSSSAFAGVISGTGPLNHIGTGTLTLSGANTYSGGTNVNAGTVALGSATALGAGPVSIAGGATLDLAGQNVALSNLSGAGNLALGAGVLTLGGSTPVSFAGTISGTGGLISNNTATVSLSGTNSYTGPTTVNSGVFNNTGSLASTVTVNGGRFVNNGSTTGSITVNAGGIYQGTGSTGGAIYGGIVAPGNSIGTTTVNGTATFLATSTYQVEVDQTGASDRLNASGNITISGGTVQVLGAAETPTTRYANVNRYTILSSGGSITGTFTGLTSNLAFLTPSLTYNSNTVVLNLLRNDVSFAAAGSTDNQRAVARAIDAAGGTSPFYAGLLGLSAAQVPAAFDQLSGEFYATAPTMLYRENSDIRRSILNHQSRSSDVEGTHFWINYLNSDAEQSAAGTSDVDKKARGYVLGGDHSFGAVRVGLSAALVDSDLTAANLGSTGDSSSQYFSAYLGGNWDRFSANIALTHGQHNIDINRAVAAAGITDSTASTLKGSSTQVYGELGYAVIDGRLKLEPFAGFAFQISNFGAGSETGGTAALDIEKTSLERPIVSLGARSAIKISEAIRLSGSVAQQFTRGSEIDRELRLRSIGRSFDVVGTPIDGNSTVYDAGLEGRFGNIHVGVSYVGEHASSYTSNAVRATLGIRF